jgi:hypothetical protein
MTHSQATLFGFEHNTSMSAILFWPQKMLPLSAEAADLQKKHGVLYPTTIHELQALRDTLNLAKSQLTPLPESRSQYIYYYMIFEDAMNQSAELRLTAPSTDMLTFGKTQLRLTFARLSTSGSRCATWPS